MERLELFQSKEINWNILDINDLSLNKFSKKEKKYKLCGKRFFNSNKSIHWAYRCIKDVKS